LGILEACSLAGALEMIDRLAGFPLNADQEDYLHAISTFVEAYEAERFPLRTWHPGDPGGCRSSASSVLSIIPIVAEVSWTGQSGLRIARSQGPNRIMKEVDYVRYRS
jgi:hypothetical protein